MDGGNGAQMQDDEDDEEEGGANMGQGMTADDYEEIDFKICGELGMMLPFDYFVEEKNRAMEEFAQTQNPEGAIQVRI